MFVQYRCTLLQKTLDIIRSKKPQFGHDGLGEVVYLRTYSRKLPSGQPERWNDTIIRVAEGILSILKSHMITNHLVWDELKWQEYFHEFTQYMFDMKFLPPGRGLWAMGTDYVYTRGSMALNNCAFASTEDLVESVGWTMNALMMGCGVGFNTDFSGEVKFKPENSDIPYLIDDSKEGWVQSTQLLIESFLNATSHPIFDYSKIRAPGTRINGFGGISAGPDILVKLHNRIRHYFYAYLVRNTEYKNLVNEYIETEGYTDASDYLKTISETYTRTRLVADIFNAIGSCVVAGNVRRSSEIALGSPDDHVFVNLKNLDEYPERSDIYWMSNNTVQFKSTDDFKKYIPDIAKQIVKSGNGEPGIFNMLNVQQFGRVNKHYDITDEYTREREPDKATGVNPCLTGDTWILTSEGWKQIVELLNKPFTAIIDEGKHESTAEGFWSNGKKSVYKVSLENGTHIRATGNHKFLSMVSGNKVWKQVHEFAVNNALCLSEKTQTSKIISITKLLDLEEVYDCSIPGKHCFSANGIISHNCGELPLESYELCNLSEVFPVRCVDLDDNFNEDVFYRAIEYATLYSSVVSLLPTQSTKTNQILARNHRIGVSLSGTVLLSEQVGYSGMIDLLKTGYKKVRQKNNEIMDMAGVPRSLRVTTIKPSGTISKLVGVPEGIHFPIENRYIIRRIRIAKNSELVPHLINNNIPYEVDTYADNTLVFEFPVDQGNTRALTEVSMWEQLKVAELFQRWWADNSVSVTINYDKLEAETLEEAISSSIPNIKTLSFAPKSDLKYVQAPVEAITKEKYIELKEKIGKIDLSGYKNGSDTTIPLYCDSEKCVIGL